MRIHDLLRRLAVWLLCRLPFPVELPGLNGLRYFLIGGRVVPPMAGGAPDDDEEDTGEEEADEQDEDEDDDKSEKPEKGDDDKDDDSDDDDEDKLPDNVKAILKKERDARRKAERENRRLKREARKPDPKPNDKPDPKKGDDEGDEDTTAAKFRRANLRAALAEEGLSKDRVKAALKLIDIDEIDFDDDDEPTNLDDVLETAYEAFPFLKGEKPKPKAKAPDSNDTDGAKNKKPARLTAEELAMAKTFGMSAEEYQNYKALNPTVEKPSKSK